MSDVPHWTLEDWRMAGRYLDLQTKAEIYRKALERLAQSIPGLQTEEAVLLQAEVEEIARHALEAARDL